jgi:hypothetical protein
MLGIIYKKGKAVSTRNSNFLQGVRKPLKTEVFKVFQAQGRPGYAAGKPYS